jgi:chemotaxis-related protein WspB
MLFLLFRLDDDRYALEAGQIVEIIPTVTVKRIPQAAAGIAGVIDYHGAPVPLVDLHQLSLGQPARQRLDTRIVIVRYPDAQGQDRLLGLLAERVTETVRRDTADFADPGVKPDAAPYLGPVAADEHGLIQWVTLDRLLPPAVRDQLFNQTAAA